MKRLIVWAAVLVVAAAFAYLWTERRNDEMLYLGIIPQTKSELIDPDGTIDVVVYFSRVDTLFVQPELIQDVRIEGSNVLTKMEVRSFEATNEIIHQNGKSFHEYRISLTFGFQTEDGFHVEWENALLVMTYKEALRLEIPIGSWSIKVGSIGIESPLSLVRLYGRKGANCSLEWVLIGIQNRTDQTIEIAGWNNGVSGVSLKMERVASDHPQRAISRLDLYGVEMGTDPFILPPGETRYLVLRLLDEHERVWRQFYLEATWSGMGMTGDFLIDDFVYVAEEGGSCDERIAEIAVRYPRGRS